MHFTLTLTSHFIQHWTAKTDGALGSVKGAASGGKKLEAETVSAETLDFLKVRYFGFYS